MYSKVIQLGTHTYIQILFHYSKMIAVYYIVIWIYNRIMNIVSCDIR